MRYSGGWGGHSSDKQEVIHNRGQKETRAISHRGGGWEVSNYRGGVRKL